MFRNTPAADGTHDGPRAIDALHRRSYLGRMQKELMPSGSLRGIAAPTAQTATASSSAFTADRRACSKRRWHAIQTPSRLIRHKRADLFCAKDYGGLGIYHRG